MPALFWRLLGRADYGCHDGRRARDRHLVHLDVLRIEAGGHLASSVVLLGDHYVYNRVPRDRRGLGRFGYRRQQDDAGQQRADLLRAYLRSPSISGRGHRRLTRTSDPCPPWQQREHPESGITPAWLDLSRTLAAQTRSISGWLTGSQVPGIRSSGIG